MTNGLTSDIFFFYNSHLVLATDCRAILRLPEFNQCGRTLNP